MKNIYLLLVVTIMLLLSNVSFSQAICGFDDIHHYRLQTDATYRQHLQDGETAIRQYIRQHPRLGQAKPIIVDKAGAPATPLSGPPYTIPVVVHIVHTGGAVGSIYNPTDAQVQGAIDYLNAVYNGTWPGTTGAGDLQIQFVLAKRDPNCNPTTGIDRTDGSGIANYVSGGVIPQGSSGPGTDEVNIKNLIRWDPTQYYNIWIVNKILGQDGTSGQFIAGYAYFPVPFDPLRDGTVMLATQMVAGQKTLPHEIGHAFNLYHPFQGSTDKNTCPPHPNNDCNLDGDQVCDTDPISENISAGIVDFTCRSSSTVNPCATPAGTTYSPNTESNYMNYTNCYTLFTAGQKARMLASAATSRSSLTTSLGGAATNTGSSPCPPKINFEISSDQATETTAATSGCRAYKDYTYNMVIGNNPSVTATATLSVNAGSTARQGLDFDITANGNFTSPSQTLTFPTGSVTTQPFTIRIYDDASVDGTRSFTLSFTVNNGGGNAVAGDGKPTFTFTINDNDAAPIPSNTTGTASLGSSLTTIPDAPFNGRIASQRTQILYKAAELTAAGVPPGPLTGIGLQLATKGSIRAFTNLNIKIGTSIVTYLLNNGVANQGSGMTVVKSLSSYNTTTGWNNFTFDTPFTWDGSSNLVVEVCYDNGSAAAGDGMDAIVCYSDGGGTNQGNIMYQTNVTCTQALSSVGGYGSGIKPIARFSYPINATVVQTVVNSSSQQYLGANADLYFYDQSNGQLMARIQNLTNHDYGCTQVVIDRQGTGASQFWNNNSANYLMNKTFRVLPANNDPAGSYNITLYYTKAEVDGWVAATSQSLSNIQIVKVSNKISDVTPANPNGAGAVVIGSPTINTLGTNTALTYNFTTGFSGFGAGIPDVPLPIDLLNFDGQLQGENVHLHWTTTSEKNTQRFGIERSYNGIAFQNIGYVDAAGASTITQQYSFTDTSIAHEKNFYRLRSVDQDDKFTYSRIIEVDGPLQNNPFTVSPSPFTTGVDITFAKAPQGRTDIRLLDMTGRTLLRRDNANAAQDRIHLDLSGLSLPEGIYLLEVRTGSNTYTTKIIKARP